MNFENKLSVARFFYKIDKINLFLAELAEDIEITNIYYQIAISAINNSILFKNFQWYIDKLKEIAYWKRELQKYIELKKTIENGLKNAKKISTKVD